MTVARLSFRCGACDLRLTPALVRVSGLDDVPNKEQAVARGTVARDDGERPHRIEATAPGYFVCAVDAEPGTRRADRWIGCCGPAPDHGPNRLCAAGHPVGTEMGDCWGPHYLLLHDALVRPEPAEDEPATPVLTIGADRALRFDVDVQAALHAVLGADDWYGADIGSLLANRLPAGPVTVVWFAADASEGFGAPVSQVRAAFAPYAPRVRLVLASGA